MDRRARRDESRQCDRGAEKIFSEFVSHIPLVIVLVLLLVIDLSRNASEHEHEHEESNAIAQCRDTRQLFPLEQFQ
jgi:hypothetical protein